jgi:hypothetical protein
MLKLTRYKTWILASIFVMAPLAIAVGQSSSVVDTQFRPSATIVNNNNLSATKAAAAQAMQQVQANSIAQQKKQQEYLQQVGQQISAAGKSSDTNTAVPGQATAATISPAVAMQKTAPAVTTQQPAEAAPVVAQPPPTATGLPDTNTPATNDAGSWPLGF